MMGFEPTTSTLARLRSTTELHPRVCFLLFAQLRRRNYTHSFHVGKPFFVNYHKKSAFLAYFELK